MQFNSKTTSTVSESLFNASAYESEATLANEQQFRNDLHSNAKLRQNEKYDENKSFRYVQYKPLYKDGLAVWSQWMKMEDFETVTDTYLGSPAQNIVECRQKRVASAW